LKVTNDAEFVECAANNHHLDEDSTDVTKQDDLGYFFDEELQEYEKEEATDDEFFDLLNKNISENDTTTKQPPQEDNLNLEEHNDYADTVGFVNDKTLFDAAMIGQLEELQRLTADPHPFGPGDWQGHTEQGGLANNNYDQTFEVDEVHITSTTPEKKHFKSNELYSPDVIPLMQFLTPPRES
jgi:hypothetical protein